MNEQEIGRAQGLSHSRYDRTEPFDPEQSAERELLQHNVRILCIVCQNLAYDLAEENMTISIHTSSAFNLLLLNRLICHQLRVQQCRHVSTICI